MFSLSLSHILSIYRSICLSLYLPTLSLSLSLSLAQTAQRWSGTCNVEAKCKRRVVTAVLTHSMDRQSPSPDQAERATEMRRHRRRAPMIEMRYCDVESRVVRSLICLDPPFLLSRSGVTVVGLARLTVRDRDHHCTGCFMVVRVCPTVGWIVRRLGNLSGLPPPCKPLKRDWRKRERERERERP